MSYHDDIRLGNRKTRQGYLLYYCGKWANGITKNFHRRPKLIREIQDALSTPGSIFQLLHVIGALKKGTQDGESLTHFNC
jgi:hypothetical protein